MIPFMLIKRNAPLTIDSESDALLLRSNQIPVRLDVKKAKYPRSL